MSSVQLGQSNGSPLSSITNGSALGGGLNSPSLTGLAPNQAPSNTSKTGKAKSSQQQQSDNISLSQGEAIGGAVGIGTAAAMLGAGGVWLAKRKSGAQETQTGKTQFTADQLKEMLDKQIEAWLSSEDAFRHQDNCSTVSTPIRIDADGEARQLPEHLPIYSSGIDGRKYASPLETGGPSFHPQQSNFNCAVDAINMLVNGYGPLRMSTEDHHLILRGYDENGVRHYRNSIANLATGVHTITPPKAFPKVYETNFKVANRFVQKSIANTLAELKYRKSAPKDVQAASADKIKQYEEDLARLKTWESELGKIRTQLGSLDREEYTPGASNSKLQTALKDFNHNKIAVAIPTKLSATANINNAAQRENGSDHHYVTLEKIHGTWWRRDGSDSLLTELKIKTDEGERPAQSIYEAIDSMHKHAKAHLENEGSARVIERSLLSTDFSRPMHVFIPRPGRV